MEPHKCAKWEWVEWSQMWQWAGEQARAEEQGKVPERKLFLPLVNLYRTRPELETALDELREH
jgi:8-oxo-dGTP diphosphatase